jgi:tetratricopeptide (TPR) repeat protein
VNKYKLRVHGVALLALIALLSSCAGTAEQRTTPRSVVTAPSPPATASEPAVVALLAAAERHAAQGQPDQAAASLERAIRIQPRDATLWHRLAKIKFAQGQFQQAQQLAAKSNALAGNDRRLKAANWQLIAAARTKLGDTAGAARARQNIKP